MKYSFDEMTQRRGSNSMKWDEAPADDIIPLWVADMDFRVAPAIQRALERRVSHGIFGYTYVAEAYYEAVISWFQRRHGWTIRREDMLYTSGVVPAVSCALKALTMPGERVVTLMPAYNCFFSSIRNTGCELLPCALRRTTQYRYEVDWQDFEAKCADEKATVFLLCNPHNPTGRVWTREELQRMSDTCRRHHVRIVSDEIHGELTMPGHTFVPFGTVDGQAVVLNSPSKSFNTAGLQIANIICADADVRRRIDRAININEVCDVNPFGPEALIAAYNESGEWFDELCQYLHANYKALCTYLGEQLPAWKVTPLEGTYLAWVDTTATGLSSDELTDRLLREARVMVSSGTTYGSEGFIRLNMACPRQRLMEGLERIANYIHTKLT